MKFFRIFYKFYKIPVFIVMICYMIYKNKNFPMKFMDKIMCYIFLFIKTIEIISVLLYNMV